jgi:trigger factor
MKTEVQDLPGNRVRLLVEVPAHDVDHAFEHALSDLSRSVRIPGFRRGKAPKPLIMRHLGRETVIEEALRDHLGAWYTRAVAVSGIDPLERPSIDWQDEPSQGIPFSFSAEVEVKPPPQVGDYTGLEAARPPVEVPDEAVAAELERLRLSIAELRPVERPAAQGDLVVIDFEGRLDGEPFEGGGGSDYGVELGSGQLLPELESGLEGMAAGERRSLPLTFPDDYPAEQLAGRSTTFEVTMKEVKERVLPELDDEFARSASEFDTLAELRADVERRLAGALEAEADMRFRSAVLDELAGRLTSEVPEQLVVSRTAEMARSMTQTLRSRGLEMSDYLAHTGQSAEQIAEAIRPQAEDAVRKDLALEAVADAEGVEIGDDQLEAWVREQAAGAGEEADAAVERLMGDPAVLTGLRHDLRLQKALDIVAASARAITPEQAEERRGQAAAREKLWTPEKEAQGAAAPAAKIWTPGSGEPAER